MELLPTELLVDVLSLAAAGRDGGALLVEAAPLVCRRWRDVVRDPRCWARVDVAAQSTPPYFYPKHVTKDHIALARARFIRRLTLNAISEAPDFPGQRPTCSVAIVEGALRASRAVAREVSVSGAVWQGLSDEGCAAFLRLLWRARRLLRSVEVCVDERALRRSGPSSRPCSKCVNPSMRLRLLEVLAELPQLEALRLHIIEEAWDYSGELAALATSRLRRLEVIADPDDPETCSGALALLADLLHGSAATLEDVAVSGWWQLPESAQTLLDACPRLTRLSVHPACLQTCALDSVKEMVLDLCVDPYSDDHFGGEDNSPGVEVLEWVTAALVRSDTPGSGRCLLMKSLRALTVQVSFGASQREVFRHVDQEEYNECCQHLMAFSDRRPEVDVKFIVSGKLKLGLPGGVPEKI